jgi:hypothetical protein
MRLQGLQWHRGRQTRKEKRGFLYLGRAPPFENESGTLSVRETWGNFIKAQTSKNPPWENLAAFTRRTRLTRRQTIHPKALQSLHWRRVRRV